MDSTLQKTANVLSQLAPNISGPTKTFQQLVKAIGEAKTKHEEDRIMRREAAILKEKMSARDTNVRQMREYLVRLIYCQMLGVECSWGHIYAVKFTQNNNIIDKRIGYLASSLLLHQDHELNMLLINSIQRDLRSSNMLEVSMALIIICRLIGEEMIPALLPLVREKLLHPKELIRKKSLLVLHHFYRCSPSSVLHLMEDFRRALSDPDPGVMEAALILLHDVIKDDPSKHKDLCDAFQNILLQVISRRLPSEFDYHSVPAPWIQMRLLQILALLGADDAKCSGEMYDVIEKALGSSECNSNIGQAITYECIRTITTIYPRQSLIQKAANSISRFLLASNNNWKYLGINALASLVQVEPKFALDHQMTVIECLDDPDETLKRKTLDLLYKMTNPANVTVITERLIAYLRTTTDDFIKTDLVGKITQLAERFSPDNQWFIDTMNSVFELGGDLVRREVAHNLMRIIAEGTEDDEVDSELRRNAVTSYLNLLDRPHLPDILIKIICWVVGEYAYEVEEEFSMEDTLDKITGLLNQDFEDPRTRSWVVNSITRLVAQLGDLPEYVHSQIALHLASEDTDVQQRCSELLEFSQNLQLMQEVLPLDSACEDIEVDSSLSFLDTFVSEALVQGASPYKPQHLRPTEKSTPIPKVPQQNPIKFEPYATPMKPTPSSFPVTRNSPSLFRKDVTVPSPSPNTPTSSKIIFEDILAPKSPSPVISLANTGIQVKGERKWSRQGYSKTTAPVIPSSDNIVITESPRQESQDEVSSPLSNNIIDEGQDNNTPSIKESSVEAVHVPQFSKEQKRKRELASALFTGVSDPSRRPLKTKTKDRGGQREEKIKQEPATTTTTEDLLLDLQDLDFSSNATPTGPIDLVQQPSTTPISTSLFDDVILMQPETTPTTIDTPPTSQTETKVVTTEVQPSTTSDDLIGLFDNSLPSETPPTAPPTISSNAFSLMDATPLIPTKDSGHVQNQTTPLAIMDAPISGSVQLPSELASLPLVPGWDKKELARDAQLRLSVSKLLNSDNLVLAMTLTNQNQNGATSVTMTIEPPSNLKASTWSDQSSNLVWTGDLEGFASSTHIITLLPISPAITMNLKGEILYKDHLNTQRRLFYDFSINPSDLIRPLKLTTPEFGKKWSTFSSEKKLKLSSSFKKPQEFMDTMATQFNFHPIEIIGSEGITSSTFLPGTPCLVHGKTTPTSLELWIRSSSGVLTESLAKQAQLVLK